MAELRPANMFLFHLFLLLSAAAAVVRREGDIITLTCESVLDGQRDCNGTSWDYYGSRSSSVVELVRLGKVKENSEIESDRLDVTADCSLLIKKVTVQEAGYYFCHQYKSDNSVKVTLVNTSPIDLFVAAVTEHEVDDEVKLECFATSLMRNCEQEVKWKIKDQDVDEAHQEIKTLMNSCSATMTVKKSHYLYQQLDFLSCEVFDVTTREKFRFRPRPSEDKKLTRTPGTFTESTTTGTSGTSGDSTGLSRYLAVYLGLAALVICVVTVGIWARAKAQKSQRDGNTAQCNEDEAAVTYEDQGEPSVSVPLP